MLPPVCALPASEGGFWTTSRPGLANLRDWLERAVGSLGLTITDLQDLRDQICSEDEHLIRRVDAADATKEAALWASEFSSGEMDPTLALNCIVANANIPWVVRVWAARALQGHATEAELSEALQPGAKRQVAPAVLPPGADVSAFSLSKVRSFSSGFTKPLPLRYSLKDQTAREILLAEFGEAESSEGRLELAAQELISAARDKKATRVRQALSQLATLNKEVHLNAATDSYERSVAIAGALAPTIVNKYLSRSARDRMASRYVDPGPTWPLASEIEWDHFAPAHSYRLSPWPSWLRQAAQAVVADKGA